MTKRAHKVIRVDPLGPGDKNQSIYVNASVFMDDECNHCWHTSPGSFYFGHPPRMAQVCCHCGEKRPEPLPFPFDGVKHGPYAPKMVANLNSLMDGAKWIDAESTD